MSSSTTDATPSTDAIPAVGMREPCPCGSGRRYKACHEKKHTASSNALRDHLPDLSTSAIGWPCAKLCRRPPRKSRCWVTLIAASSSPPFCPWHGRQWFEITVISTWPLQVTTGSGDPSRDAAAALQTALTAEREPPFLPRACPTRGPRLQDLVVAQPLQITVHDTFDYWMSEDAPGRGVRFAIPSIERMLG